LTPTRPAKHGGRKRSINVREVLTGIFYALRLPVEGAAEGPATEEHGALLLHAVGLGRHAGAYSKRFFTGLPAFHFCAVNFPLQPEWLNIETESLMPPRLHEVAGRALLACAHRPLQIPQKGGTPGLGHALTITSRERIRASRRRQSVPRPACGGAMPTLLRLPF
jgi:hypothetical protein